MDHTETGESNNIQARSFIICKLCKLSSKKVKQSRYRPGVAQRVPGS